MNEPGRCETRDNAEASARRDSLQNPVPQGVSVRFPTTRTTFLKSALSSRPWTVTAFVVARAEGEHLAPKRGIPLLRMQAAYFRFAWREVPHLPGAPSTGLAPEKGPRIRSNERLDFSSTLAGCRRSTPSNSPVPDHRSNVTPFLSSEPSKCGPGCGVPMQIRASPSAISCTGGCA